MRYTREQMEQWDEYAVHETLKREGREEGILTCIESPAEKDPGRNKPGMDVLSI